MKDEFWKQQYEIAGNSWDAWRLRADELLMGASILNRLYSEALPRRVRGGKAMHSNVHLGGPSRLLQAAALEALLKARALRRGHRFVVHGQFRPIPGTEKDPHNLVLLAKVTGLRLSRKTSFLLRRLSLSFEGARYPIRKHWARGLEDAPHPGVGKVSLSFEFAADAETMRGLVKRLRASLK